MLCHSRQVTHVQISLGTTIVVVEGERSNIVHVRLRSSPLVYTLAQLFVIGDEISRRIHLEQFETSHKVALLLPQELIPFDWCRYDMPSKVFSRELDVQLTNDVTCPLVAIQLENSCENMIGGA